MNNLNEKNMYLMKYIIELKNNFNLDRNEKEKVSYNGARFSYYNLDTLNAAINKACNIITTKYEDKEIYVHTFDTEEISKENSSVTDHVFHVQICDCKNGNILTITTKKQYSCELPEMLKVPEKHPTFNRYIQRIGSATTYISRYCRAMFFNLVSDEDTDKMESDSYKAANAVKPQTPAIQQLKVEKEIESKTDAENAEELIKISSYIVSNGNTCQKNELNEKVRMLRALIKKLNINIPEHAKDLDAKNKFIAQESKKIIEGNLPKQKQRISEGIGNIGG